MNVVVDEGGADVGFRNAGGVIIFSLSRLTRASSLLTLSLYFTLNLTLIPTPTSPSHPIFPLSLYPSPLLLPPQSLPPSPYPSPSSFLSLPVPLFL